MAKLLALEALEAEGAVPGHVPLLVALEASLGGVLFLLLLGLRTVSRHVSASSAVVAAPVAALVSSSTVSRVASASVATISSIASASVAAVASSVATVASATVASFVSSVAVVATVTALVAALERLVSFLAAFEALHFIFLKPAVFNQKANFM